MKIRPPLHGLCLLLLSACTVTVPGEPWASEKVVQQLRLERTPLTVDDAFGDIRRADYCALLNDIYEHLPDDVDVARAPDTQITYCMLDILNGDSRFWVEVGHVGQHPNPTMGGRKLKRGLRVVPNTSQDDLCSRSVQFPDGIVVNVLAGPDEDEKAPEHVNCEVADLVADIVAANLVSGRAREFTGLHAATLLDRDLCDLVPSAALRRSGLSTEVVRAPDGHTCLFGEQGELAGVATLELSGDLEVSGDLTTLAGRETAVDRASDACTVSGQGAIFPVRHNLRTLRELVVLTVYRTGDIDPCVAAKRIAGAVWPELPKPG